jgi:L-lactate dehydrogenase complex protein LldG
LFRAFSSARAFERAQRAARLGSRPLARNGRIGRLPWPLSGWTETRDLPEPPKETFREWWRRERGDQGGAEIDAVATRLVDSPAYGRENRPIAEGDHARSVILARIQAALQDRPLAPEVPREYRQSSDDPRPTVIARFSERVGEYQASVRSATRSELRTVLADMAAQAGAERLAVPTDLPPEWRPDNLELTEDASLSAHDLDTLDGALTGCALAIAETGTIVLDGGDTQGRRALSLVPDYHLCVVEAEAIVATVPEAVKSLEPAVKEGRPLTFVSGPSATSDIELNRVEGVHGPRTLHVVVLT